MEETSRYPDVDVTEGIMRILGSRLLEVISNTSPEQLQAVNLNNLVRDVSSLTRAVAYKKNVDVKTKDILRVGEEQFTMAIFETLHDEKPELYKELRTFIKSKKE